MARLENIVQDPRSRVATDQNDNAYIVDQRPFQELTPNDELLELIPSMSGANFYKKPISDESHNLNSTSPGILRTPCRITLPPLVGPYRWPQNSGDDQKVDKFLAKYQEQCALLTKPLDAYATTIIGSNKYDNGHKES
ncbi:hypothetical protein BGZ50_007769, partial [Haplosporangium sp. Z 11]